MIFRQKNRRMTMSTEKKKQTPIEKLAALIVDKRKAFYLFYIIAGIFCAVAMNRTKVNNDITSYLPDSSERLPALPAVLSAELRDIRFPR